MRREAIDHELKDLSFELFYWFSRFEFALKENRYLKSEENGSKAEPDWGKFVEDNHGNYQLTDVANRLIELHPKRQIVGENKDLIWKKVGIEDCKSNLCIVVRMLKTIRNNLFHGGKHGDSDMDSKKRNCELLRVGKMVLDQLAAHAGIEADYTRYY